MSKIWKWIDHNRFVVTGPIVAIMIWACAISCTPLTVSPLDPRRMVTAPQLEIDFMAWQAQQEITAVKFEAAGQDLEQQKANNKKIEQLILGLASGGVADMPGLMKLLVAGGGLGAITDNIRKRGLISGLKRNNGHEPPAQT
ncbi:hypothetical protein ES703_112769 [subsurface metagenome]